MAECLLLAGRPDAAFTLAEEAQAQARGLGGVPAQIPLIQRIRGAVLARAGSVAGALEALNRASDQRVPGGLSTKKHSRSGCWPRWSPR